ncbi:MAG: hypothetical protein AAB380_06140 [Verrucomicrobiota bacterium]
MDAALKRRMWKVAIAHFLLTILFVLVAWLQSAYGFSGNAEKRRRFEESLVWQRSYQNIMKDVGFLLQPQFWLLYKARDFVTLQNLVKSLPSWLVLACCLLSVPIWSICFGWIFVKLDNWLNHFPVLGRRVF